MSEDYRYEIKFILNEMELVEASSFLKKIGAFKSYPSRVVNSLYFDTIDFQGVIDNLAGVSNRHKVRLRWYNEIDKNNKLILEVKKRIGRLGSKSKYEIHGLEKDILSFTGDKVRKYVFDYIYKNYQYDHLLNEYYIPTLLVNYQREYYECEDDVRITIDNNIKFSNVTQKNNIFSSNKFPYNEYIMELKFPTHMKDVASRMIRNLNLVPKRHSKYMTGMSKLGYTLYI